MPQIQDITTDIYGIPLHYRNDTRLRRAETKIHLRPEHIEEYKKSKSDIVYFIENYCKINDPDRGLVHPTLYPWQKEFLVMMQENRFVISMVARQSGKTVLAALFLTWYMIFHNDKTNMILAQRGKTAREIFSRVLQIYRSIPQFMKAGVYEYNKSSIVLDTGSRTIADATTEEGLRGYTVNGCLLIDETAIIKKNLWEEFFAAVLPTISRAQDSKMILTSTPKGRNHFFELWNSAITGQNGFKPFKATWRDIPGRTEQWKIDEIKKMTGTQKEEKFRQEFECLSGDSIITIKDNNGIIRDITMEELYSEFSE